VVPKSANVVIVGGGVVGCATAYWLAKAGHEPLLLERSQLGCEASGEAAGMLAPQSEADQDDGFFRLCLAGRALFPSLAEELRGACGIEIEYRQIGSLLPFFAGKGREVLLARAGWQRERGLGVEVLDRPEAVAAEPLLADTIEGAIFLPDEAHVNSHALVRALAAGACRHGATLLTGCPAIELLQERGRVVGVRTAWGVVSAPRVVLAAGPWSALFGEALGVRIPVTPAKGELLLATVEDRLPSRIVYSKLAYLIPTPRGEAILGTTTAFVGYDKRPTLEGVRTIVDGVSKLVPAIRAATFVRAWAGLRPHTPDERPILGPHPDLEGLILATGHHRNGILLGPLTGQLVHELISGLPTTVPIEEFRPDRPMPGARPVDLE
jgi:glycine oxidase